MSIQGLTTGALTCSVSATCSDDRSLIVWSVPSNLAEGGASWVLGMPMVVPDAELGLVCNFHGVANVLLGATP